MFTGIIEEVGDVAAIEWQGRSARLTASCRAILEDARPGDSVAVNGVCLTVTDCLPGGIAFDAVAETLTKSSLGQLKAGDPVNLERALKVGGRIGGHFVQGHVDGTGRVLSFRPVSNSAIWSFSAPPGLMRYIVPKGAIAVDGISLTVVEVSEGGFTVSIIPFTVSRTNLAHKRAGEAVNLEVDILGKYVEKLLAAGRQEPSEGITEAFLVSRGF
ncbi:MAG: riboflavin synthase [Armatimonadetes bacterium]|nr:riboflavin synthase [Armatimonadota bacterium]